MNSPPSDTAGHGVELLCWAVLLICIGLYVMALGNIDRLLAEEREENRRFWRRYYWKYPRDDDQDS